MSATQLATWIFVALAGAIGHEVAHYLVWLATGRQPRLHLRELHVTPHAGPVESTVGDRVSAAAPYVIGIVAVLWAVTSSSPLFGIFGLAMIQIPSRADVETMLGTVSWASLAP